MSASTQKKVDAVTGQLYDHVTALDIMLTAAQSTQVSPYVSGGTVETIITTKAKASEAVAALEVILAAENAAELVEQGLKEAHEAVVEIVKKGKV